MPRHLDRFEFGLVRPVRVIVELVEVDHPLAQVGKTDVHRIESRMILGQHFGDFFRLVPFQSHCTFPPCPPASAPSKMPPASAAPQDTSSIDFFSSACLIA